MQRKVGRPSLTLWDKYQLAHKLEPYLKMGMSVKKACRISGIPSSTVYKYMELDEEFMFQIEAFRQYFSILVSTSVMKVMLGISKKQANGLALSYGELQFVMWIATHSNLTHEEFVHKGERAKQHTPDPYESMRMLVKSVRDAV